MPKNDDFGLEPRSWLKHHSDKTRQQLQQIPHEGRLPNQPLPASPDEVCDKDNSIGKYLDGREWPQRVDTFKTAN